MSVNSLFDCVCVAVPPLLEVPGCCCWKSVEGMGGEAEVEAPAAAPSYRPSKSCNIFTSCDSSLSLQTCKPERNFIDIVESPCCLSRVVGIEGTLTERLDRDG